MAIFCVYGSAYTRSTARPLLLGIYSLLGTWDPHHQRLSAAPPVRAAAGLFRDLAGPRCLPARLPCVRCLPLGCSGVLHRGPASGSGPIGFTPAGLAWAWAGGCSMSPPGTRQHFRNNTSCFSLRLIIGGTAHSTHQKQ